MACSKTLMLADPSAMAIARPSVAVQVAVLTIVLVAGIVIVIKALVPGANE